VGVGGDGKRQRLCFAVLDLGTAFVPLLFKAQFASTKMSAEVRQSWGVLGPQVMPTLLGHRSRRLRHYQ
jgi:hypothetical protein